MEHNNEGQVVKKVDRTSNIKPTEFRYRWTIKNFSLCIVDPGKSLDSPEFEIQDPSGIFILLDYGYFKLYPNGFSNESENYVSVQLYTSEMYEFEYNTSVAISVLNNDGVELNKCEKDFSKIDFDTDSAVFEYFLHKQTLIEKSNELLPNDQLTILCKITRQTYISKKELYQTIIEKRRLSEFDDFEKLLKKPKFSDVEIVVDDQVFEAHKAILSARSRVFQAMFEHGMKEQTENKIVISDVDTEVMELVLRYIYAGKLELDELERLRLELYMMADKYELDGLKHVCKDTMIENLSVDNVADALTFIDMLPSSKNVETLERTAINFVIDHSSELMCSDSFQKACQSLSAPLLTKIINIFMAQK